MEIAVRNALVSDSIHRKNTFLIRAQGDAKDSAIIKIKNVEIIQTKGCDFDWDKTHPRLMLAMKISNMERGGLIFI